MAININISFWLLFNLIIQFIQLV